MRSCEIMCENVIKDEIVQVLGNLGVLIGEEELSRYSIGEIIPNSLLYISFIVELEQVFNVEIPDEYLDPKKIMSINSIVELVHKLKLNT